MIDEIITEKPAKNAPAKTTLTEGELQAIWQQDEYWGVGGSYIVDPFTGKRTPNEG